MRRVGCAQKGEAGPRGFWGGRRWRLGCCGRCVVSSALSLEELGRPVHSCSSTSSVRLCAGDVGALEGSDVHSPWIRLRHSELRLEGACGQPVRPAACGVGGPLPAVRRRTGSRRVRATVACALREATSKLRDKQRGRRSSTSRALARRLGCVVRSRA